MKIDEIFFNKELSSRAFNTCVYNKIDTVSELKDIYTVNGSFKLFRNCGEKTNLELISLCLKYIDIETEGYINKLNENEFSIQKINNVLNTNQRILIDEFIKVNFSNLSVRTKNGARRYLNDEINLNGFSKKIFSKPNLQLNQLRNLGSKSIKELEIYIKKIKDYIVKIYEIKGEDQILIEKSIVFENKLETNINTLNRFQRNIINNYISITTEQLTARSKNAINYFLENKLNINNFLDKIFFNENFDVINIKNIGKGSILELKLYLNDIEQFLNKIVVIKNESELNKLNAKVSLNKAFKNVIIPESIVDSNSVFKLVDYLINENVIFNKVDTFIFKETYNIYTISRNKSLDYIGDIIGLSRERIRQKRKELLEEFSLKVKIIKSFDKNLLINYFVDLNHNSIVVSDEKAQYINFVDETDFSKHFLLFIISFLFEDEYRIIGNQEDVLVYKDINARYRHNWQGLYLIKNDLIDVFYFEKLIDDLEERINERIQETYKFNFKSYLSRFLKKDDFIHLDEIFSVCERIINEEFNIYLNIEEDIVFERNTIKTIPEYAYEALESLGVPSHIEDIDKQVRLLNPTFDKTISNANLKREFGFVSFSRTSVYGLKKWENQSNNIKSGTIRSIAEEFLADYSKPMNIKDVAKFVLQYRPESNEKSILYNLKMEDNNRFVFFKNAFIGLKSKKYDLNEYALLNENEKATTRTWEENYKVLLDFISNNNKLPSSINCSLEEIRINRWLNNQRSKVNRNLLDNSKSELIIKIISNYNLRKDKTTLFRNDRYNELLKFVKENKRLPSAGQKVEIHLYNFFYEQRKLFENSELGSEEKLKFLEVAKSTQKN